MGEMKGLEMGSNEEVSIGFQIVSILGNSKLKWFGAVSLCRFRRPWVFGDQRASASCQNTGPSWRRRDV